MTDMTTYDTAIADKAEMLARLAVIEANALKGLDALEASLDAKFAAFAAKAKGF